MSFAIGHIGNELKSNSINVQTIITSTQTTTTTTTTTKTNTTNNNNTIYVITNTKCNECATNSIYVSLDHQNPPPTTVPLIHRSTDPLTHYHNHQCHQITNLYMKKKKNKIFIYQLTEPIKFNRLLYAKCEQKSNEINQNLKWNPNRIVSINISN